MSDQTNSQPLLRVEDAFEGELFVGKRLTVGDRAYLIFNDQAGMPGIRSGDAFTPDYGKTIDYREAGAPTATSSGERLQRMAKILVRELTDAMPGIHLPADSHIEHALFHAILASPPEGAPAAAIDMVLHCPNCGLQHIDAADHPTRAVAEYTVDTRGIRHVQPIAADVTPPWTNPPHRSHLCSRCGHIWRPADVPTNGVRKVLTEGRCDSPLKGGA